MPPSSSRPKEHRISNITLALMIVVALLYDAALALAQLLTFIPYAGAFAQIVAAALVNIWALLTFYLWFRLHGITFIGPKRIAALPLAALIKQIPIVGALPAWSAAVFFLFFTMRAEELLEKAGPAGTLVSKALAAGTQGSLSVARSQKSEAEKTAKAA